MTVLQADDWLWMVWYLTWWLAALCAAKPAARPVRDVWLFHRWLGVAGIVLLFMLQPHSAGLQFAPPVIVAPLWRAPAAAQWALFVFTAAGFAFCWWARVHLFALWSGFVTVKAAHRVVDTGPYRLVRHPIYTGVIAAAVFTAALAATPAALIGAALIAASFWKTALIEEAFLRAQLGASAYDSYSRRTPMLIPLLRS
jgi:protein-S-isoprenylcysteine O-methyltransferase Ste14